MDYDQQQKISHAIEQQGIEKLLDAHLVGSFFFLTLFQKQIRRE